MGIARRLSQRQLLVPLALSAVAFLIVFWQRPHERFSDQRVELITDPSRFLSQVGTLWSSTIDLGHIQASQFVGYLFPIGPFFALGQQLGIPLWIVQRLWIGLLLAVGAWGLVRLLERLFAPRTQLAGLIAGLFYLSSPFVMITLNRGDGWLLPYALLPWLLLWTQRGIGSPRGWRAPAMLALLLAAAGGGLNAAVLAWLLVAMFLLIVFEALTVSGWRAAFSFSWRAAVLSIIASLWWIIPVLAQARYGTDYLTFTEHAESILHTPSASESLRLLGYWVGYINGYPDSSAQVPAMSAYLLGPATIFASFTIPAIAVATMAALRRLRYVAFLGLLLTVGVLAMSAGFPASTPAGRALTDLYYSAGPLQFMRTTYKAAPLVALAIASLSGLGLGLLADRLRFTRLRWNSMTIAPWLPRAALALFVLGLVAFWGRPLWVGNAINSNVFISGVPGPWTAAIDDAQRTTPPGTRISVLPGELFAYYRWGGTQNSIVPAVSKRPVLIRQIDRPSSPQAAQLLTSVDSQVQQGRLMPNQLPPLLQIMGVGRTLVGTDSSPTRNEALDPADVSAALVQQPGFQTPAATFGPTLSFAPPADRSGATVTLPQVRSYAAPDPAQPRIERVHPADSPSVVDGDADGIIAMAAVGALDPRRASFYAADVDRRSLAGLTGRGARLVFTDSNRRRVVLASKVRINLGATLGAHDPINRIFSSYDPFPGLGAAGRTVAVYTGLRELWTPLSNDFTLFPEHRPYAAFDGRLDTSWISQAEAPQNRFIQMTLREPRAVGTLSVHPHRDEGGSTIGVAVSVNGGPERRVLLRPGWNGVPLNATGVRTLRLRVFTPKDEFFRGGLDEVRIPGLRVREALRLPTDLARLAAGADLASDPLEVVLERTTADFPRRAGAATGGAALADPVDMTDAEPGMRRIVTLPAGRRFTADGWASVVPSASDAQLDRLAKMPGPSVFTSSSRFEGLPRYRASSAFDGNPGTAWAAEFSPRRLPWVQWRSTTPVAVRELRIAQPAGAFRKANGVTVSTPLGGFDLPVGADGVVRLPARVTTRSLRITVRTLKALPRATAGKRRPRAIAFTDVDVVGVAKARPRRSGPFTGACGSVRLASTGQALGMRVRGSLEDLDVGNPLRAEACGTAGLQLRAGANLVVAAPGPVFTVDYLHMTASAPRPLVAPNGPASIDQRGNVTLTGGGWLVLGQSYSTGWRAWCTDSAGRERGLGAPRQIDGFANGWAINGRGCARARFAFAPQRAANVGYAVSAIGGLAMLALLIFGAWRRRRRGESVAQADRPAAPEMVVRIDTHGPARLTVEVADAERRPFAVAITPCRPGWPATVAGCLIAGATALALSGSPVAAAGVALSVVVLLRLGLTPSRLYALAAIAIAMVGVVYVARPNADAMGINFNFPLDHVAGHWLALTAVLMVLAGVVLEVDRLRRARPTDPAAAGPP